MPGRLLLATLLLIFTLGCSGPEPAAPAAAATPAPSTAGPATVDGRGPTNALVMLEPVGQEPPLPDGPVILDQYGRAFVPDLLFVRVGQVVEFRNSEDVDHNIRVVRNPTGTTVMDVSGSQHNVFKHTFEQAGSYDVTCDVHPGMRGTIVASRTPFAAMSDGSGAFSLKDVPPGAYTLRVVAQGRETTQPVEVTGPRTELTVSRR